MNGSLKLNRIRRLTNLEGIFYALWEYDKATSIFTCDQEYTNILGVNDDLTSQEEIFSWLTESLVFVDNFNKLVDEHKNLDVVIAVHHKGQKSLLRVIGTYCEDETTICGSIKNITQDVRKDLLFRNRNIEFNSYEKGLEQFSIVARTDAHGRITYANEEFCRLSQYTEQELIGKDHRIINSGFHPKEFFQEMWSTVLAGQNWRGVIRNKAKDGTFYWVDTILIPFTNTKGDLTEILSFRFDVTQIQIMKEENLALKQELEQLKVANQKLREF